MEIISFQTIIAQCRMMHAVSIEKKREGQVMGATQNFAYDFKNMSLKIQPKFGKKYDINLTLK